jgi:hypothetical protein
MSRTLDSKSWGAAVSRSTPKGLAVRSRTSAIWATSSGWAMADAPMQPKPPASDTAATSSA